MNISKDFRTSGSAAGLNAAGNEGSEQVREDLRTLISYLRTKGRIQRIDLVDEDGRSHRIPLDESSLHLLWTAMDELATDDEMKNKNLGFEEAAQELNVSQDFLHLMIEIGEILPLQEGEHAVIRRKDVLGFKERVDALRHEALNELVEEAQLLGLGYE